MNTEKNFDFWHFLHFAFEDYCKYVKTGKKTYDRFRKDFINGHKRPIAGEDENVHEMIMGSIGELLTLRRKLVEHYFCRLSLTEEELIELMDAHNSTDAGQHPLEMQSTKKQRKELNQEFTFRMNDDQFTEIAKWMNGANTDDEWHMRMCKEEMSGEKVKEFFYGNVKIKAAKNMNQYILMLLDALRDEELISRYWGRYFEKKQNIISSKDDRPLTDNSMRRNLSAAKKRHDLLMKKFLEKAKEIAKMSQ